MLISPGTPESDTPEARIAVLEAELAASQATAAEAQAVAKALVDKGVLTAKDITDAAVDVVAVEAVPR